MKIFCHYLTICWIGIMPCLVFSQNSRQDSLENPKQSYNSKILRKKLEFIQKHIEGIPVIIEKDTLFYIYTNRGSLLPAERAKQIESIVEQLGKTFRIKPNRVYIISDDYTSDIMYEGKIIISLTDKDAYYTQISRRNLAFLEKEIIVETLQKLQEKHGLERAIKNNALVILVIMLQIALLWTTNFAYQKLRKKVRQIRKKFLKPFFIKNYHFIGVERQTKIIYFILKLIRLILILIECIAFVLILFGIFPPTKNLAFQFLLLLWNPIKKIGIDIVHYLPDVCTIIIIWLIFRYIVKGIKVVAEEIGRERFKLPGFYPEWAKPTFGIFRFLLYAFMAALIYPHLPHSESEAFKGISVLIGLIFSIGSSSAINNLIAGIIITYMRSFKTGDRIKIGEITGDVIEKTSIAIRIMTLKNEIVTIPNATVTNAQTINLSESAKTKGLIIHCEVTFGYDTPWRKIHQLLLDGAEATSQILKEPHPFVLETAFDDFYTIYQINTYVDHADHLLEISSELRQNIQDKFQEAGLNMTSLHYYQQKNK